MSGSSPYEGLDRSLWLGRTKELVEAHPFNPDEIVEVVLESWNSIFESKIGISGFTIGEHIVLKPQLMGTLLEQLIVLELEFRYPEVWRGERAAKDKDLVYAPDEGFSVEIKTSSSAKNIYGNRSYAQEPKAAKKSKSGYYVAVNFEKFSGAAARPRIRLVRFGWLDHADWLGQASQTGQQARLDSFTEQNKLMTLFSLE